MILYDEMTRQNHLIIIYYICLVAVSKLLKDLGERSTHQNARMNLIINTNELNNCKGLHVPSYEWSIVIHSFQSSMGLSLTPVQFVILLIYCKQVSRLKLPNWLPWEWGSLLTYKIQKHIMPHLFPDHMMY